MFRAAPPLFRKNTTGAAISREQELFLWPIVSASSNQPSSQENNPEII
jgi:hypothetical protein